MQLKIEKYDYEGRGIAYENNMVVFVPEALKGEVVDCEIVKTNKHYKIAKVLEVIKSSPLRKKSFCPFSSLCGGCTLDICDVEHGLKIKTEGLKDLFFKNGLDIKDFKIVANPEPLYYRNKISLIVKNGEFGFQKENTHEFVSIKKCYLAQPVINEILDCFAYFSFLNGKLTIRTNNNHKVLIIIETKDKVNINPKLYEKPISGLIINNKVIYGKNFLEEQRSEFYQINYDSFFQVNPYVSNLIVQKLLSFLNPQDIVLDLYCGVGFFTFPMARKVIKVVGIEVVANAIKNAKEAQKVNKLANITFYQGRVENMIDKQKEKFTKVVVDPPRSGLDKKTKEYLLQQAFSEIIYISCNPLTLVRDLKDLQSKYQITFLEGYDMFTFTKHVESFCVLSLR